MAGAENIIQLPGWSIRLTKAGNLDISCLPTPVDSRVLVDVRPVSHRQVFLIRRRIGFTSVYPSASEAAEVVMTETAPEVEMEEEAGG